MKTKFSYRMVKQCVSLLVTILLAIFAAVWLPCKKAQTLWPFWTQVLCFALFVIVIVWWIRRWTKKYFEKRANREIVLEDGKIEEGTILKAAWIRKEENGAAKNFLKIQCTVPSPSGDLVQDFANIPVSSDHLSSMRSDMLQCVQNGREEEVDLLMRVGKKVLYCFYASKPDPEFLELPDEEYFDGIRKYDEEHADDSKKPWWCASKLS